MIPSRLFRPYRPLRSWFAFRIAEVTSPRPFSGHRVAELVDVRRPPEWLFEHAKQLAKERKWKDIQP